MIIIKEGDITRLDRYKKFECDKCGCIFVSKQGEYVNCSSQRDGTLFQCKCPTCWGWVNNYSDSCVDPVMLEKGVLKEVK